MKVVFLDRDGVINSEVHYLHKIADFEYTYKCVDALTRIRSAGYQVIIITNQAGIAKGIFGKSDYDELTKFYTDDLSNHGIDILDIFYCPHHIDGTVLEYKLDCVCRKPKPGMLTKAIAKYSVDVTKSFFVGDKLSDIEAARAANIGSPVLVESGHKLDPSVLNVVPNYKNLYDFSLQLGAG